METDIALRDGSTARVRAVRPDDAERLADFYAGLSEQSRVFRFFSAGANLRRAAARSAEARDGGGLVASVGERLIGHAEYVRYGEAHAEVAFTVADTHHGHGISTLLLAQLAQAASAEGVQTFTATVMPDNHKMVGAFRGSGFPVEVRPVEGELEVTFPTALDAAGRARFEDRERRAAVAALAHVLRPASVAVVASGAGGEAVAAVLEAGLEAYGGLVHRVRPGGSVLDVAASVELALVAVDCAELLGVARDCAAAGVRALVVLSEGTAGAWDAGGRERAELLRVCRAAGMRLVGPGSLGVLGRSGGVRLDAVTAPELPPPGGIAFGTQSAALGLVGLDSAARRGLGLSSFVSLGDKQDLSGNDLLQAWEADEDTRVAVLYLEHFGNPRKFARIARRVGARKPVVVVKSGRALGAGRERGDGSRLRALVAAEAGVDALLRSAGVVRTGTLGEALDAAALFAAQPLPRGDRVAVVANARGPGVVCADACVAAGLRLGPLAASTRAALRRIAPRATVGNPADLTAAATAEQVAEAVRVVLGDPGVDAVAVPFVQRLAASAAEVLEALRPVAAASPAPVLPVLLGPGRPAPAPDLPVFANTASAARALGRAAAYARHRAAPPDEPGHLPGTDPDHATARVAAALADGGGELAHAAAAALLRCWGIVVEPDARGGSELLAGTVADPRLGPLVAVAAGGAAAEVVRDVQVRLAPVGPAGAAAMLAGLRSATTLRGGAAVDLTDLLVRVAALAAAHPEVTEVALDPVVAGPDGSVAVGGARVVLGPPPARRPPGTLDR